MATGTLKSTGAPVTTQTATGFGPLAILKMLGSLKITVAMFAMSIFIIFVGTLAQDDLDLASVKRQFFTCWIASIPFDVFFPRTLFKHTGEYAWGAGFYFPGGATIGLVLLVNLIAAKATRFKVFAKGSKLLVGCLISAFGAALIAVVIWSGQAAVGLQGTPPIAYDTVWACLKGGLVLLTVVLAGYAIVGKLPPLARALTAGAACIALILSVFVVMNSTVRLDDPGLRIVWQLTKATVASCVMLAGLWMIFGQRGGNVLIHLGVGLLMVGQFVFGDRQIEQRMGLAEGESTNLVVIEDEIEIALIDVSNPDEDKVYAVGEPLIRKYAEQEIIDSPILPCKVRILKWMQNSKLAAVDSSKENLATTGLGLQAVAVERPLIGGAIMDDRNIASAYVELISKDSGDSLGTLLLCQERNDISQLTSAMQADQYERIEIDGKPFDVGIRFRQLRKPYDVKLEDVVRIDYSGTDTPRDYSSRIIITDRETGETQEGKTWMNNPLRYGGETFYQSRYNKIPTGDGKLIETTGLQVVKNAGWVIPYMCCMMAFVGMGAHFAGTFLRFANRYARGALPGAELVSRSNRWKWTDGVIACLALGFCVLVAAAFARSPSYDRTEVDWGEVATIPVQHEGRIKPLDTVARNVLQVIAQPTFGLTPRIKDKDDNNREPSEWLLSVMAGEEWVKDVKIFRIYSNEVRDLFDLSKRSGYRYAYTELAPNMEKFRTEVGKLRSKDSDDFDLYEEQIAGMHRQLNLFDLLSYSYQMPPLSDPSTIQTDADRNAYLERLVEVAQLMQRLEDGGPPALIPPAGEATKENLVDAKWQPLGPAVFASLMSQLGLQTGEQSPALLPLDDLFSAIRSGDASEIDESVRGYKKVVAGMPLASIHIDKAETESWLNRFNPTGQGVALYVLATLIGLLSFLVRMATGNTNLQKATFWLLAGIFVIHTIALIARIYVSGRAPVINLYSSAVFIGWACVLLALFLEWVYPIGVANLVAAVIGASTLSVARFLDTQDTLHVLQAVLDTPFWLSTHVITVSLGYAVTFLAGFLGLAALTHRMITGVDSYPKGTLPETQRVVQDILYRMTFATLCFAIFFSFIGTVLGGLWADDSWGRFWGWDPKENGALMIVLWNALILHANWDKQVGPRGFAILAVLGNIVTAWSWFGTNQLGIGLHSYGFTNGALITLSVFMAANLLFVIGTLVVTSAMSSGARRLSEAAKDNTKASTVS